MIPRPPGWLLALVLAACSPHGEESQAPETAIAGVAMDAATQARMGVQVGALAPMQAPKSIEGYARVLDIAPLAALDAEAQAASAAAAASRAEYERLRTLAAMDQAASTRAVEAARAQAAADNARAALAAQRIGLEWGAGLARLSVGERARLVRDVSRGAAALIRVDTPAMTAAPKRITIQIEASDAPLSATLLGLAGAADARLQTAGVLAVVRGAPARLLASGHLLKAQVESGVTEAGRLIPSAAIVRADNSAWVFVRTAPDRFERRDITSGHAVANGWFVTEGFDRQDAVVVAGATSLLAAESGPVEAD